MSKYLLGFDIGGTNARCALIQCDDQFKILVSQKHAIRSAQSPQDLALLIKHVVANIGNEHNVKPDMISGLGIAIAGQIAIDEHTIINAPNLNWHNINFYDIIKRELAEIAPDIRVRIANDLNAIAWGEYQFGAAKAVKSLLAVYVGTGIGAGLIMDGNLVLGADNVCGEIGHCKFPGLHDAMCGCGQRGCVEAYAGGKAIEYRILHDIQTGVVSREELALDKEEHPTARAIEKSYKAGLPYAVKFWQETSVVIGLLISNAIAIINPHALLLGGGVLQGCPELLSRVLENIVANAPKTSTANLQFIKPTLHDDAGTLGAALLCLHE